ncbi:trypsin-like peptidase domain-containing protein [Microbulbifer elongatus]|uniref:Trypsin-like peptidase domain-containing protein n=1 Tax=Microbulbifer elongatus TaxID=86173 RepID=A0ABT1NYI9_9GAMM|nr:serine protease [Microbulbifer elongatus]MCQ3828950.1 trypsin-like peptidase domain-containing protein [Microbulbifer elongatus]
MTRIFSRQNYRAIFHAFVAVTALHLYASVAKAQSYEQLYSDYRGSLYQIRLIEHSSNSKAGLGSGFQISQDGLIATNYHVVSEAVHDADKYVLKYLSVDGKEGELELLDVDVVNDLAILRQKGTPGPDFLQLASQAPSKGETIVSMGNPLDLGMTIVPGTYNGIAGGSFYDRIHFSGSINPGMSGGPVINRNGQVVGINVATAGNQISFLVPVDKLVALLQDYKKDAGEGNGALELQPVINRQLHKNQQRIIDQILDANWQLRPLGDAMVVGEIVPSIQCWGNTSDDEDEMIKQVAKGCTGQDVVFLSETFDTGRVEYEFFWLESEDDFLSSRFYAAYEENMSGFFPGNSAGEDDVTDFNCKQQFTTHPRNGKTHSGDGAKNKENGEASGDEAQTPPKANGSSEPVIARTSYCVRRYKDYPELFDVFYVSLTVDHDNRALVSHFTLSGFTQESATAFTQKFASEVQWH